MVCGFQRGGAIEGRLVVWPDFRLAALRDGFGQKLRTALRGSAPSALTYEALLEPIISAAEAVERLPDDAHVKRGGRPRKQFTRPLRNIRASTNGITRGHGQIVNAEMVDLLMDQLRHLLHPLPVNKLTVG